MPNLSQTRIDQAIVAHADWRRRLEQSIQERGQGLQIGAVAADDRCELGRLLASLPEAEDDADLRQLRCEHTRFHEHAARIVQMAIEGRVAAANRALQGEYELISAELVRLLRTCGAGA
ncbi:MAG: CZB domain-containing protein [Planctomycetes bacterium]|nr:CZB domain-containing protein [Planctomycetota bacterium]